MANPYQPSRIRREGREAYFRGGNPTEQCPPTYVFDGRGRNWLDGWEEAAKEDRAKPDQSAKHPTPWRLDDICSRCNLAHILDANGEEVLSPHFMCEDAYGSADPETAQRIVGAVNGAQNDA